MPAVHIDIPIPIHLLMNPEMYIFDLCSNMSIDLKVAFNPASSLFDRTNTFGPCLFALRTFNLNFIEYDPQDPYHGDVDPRVQIGTTIKLVNGYYVIDGRSYNSATPPALVVDGNKRFALLNITNVEVNTNVLSFKSWKLCISEPIVEPNYFNSFVVKKFVILNRRDNVYLTLDDETRLEVESITYDDTQTKTINKKELQFGF